MFDLASMVFTAKFTENTIGPALPYPKKEEITIAKIQSFFSHLSWKCQDEGAGGITWNELYALYALHGGNKDEEEDLKQPQVANTHPWTAETV